MAIGRHLTSDFERIPELYRVQCPYCGALPFTKCKYTTGPSTGQTMSFVAHPQRFAEYEKLRLQYIKDE